MMLVFCIASKPHQYSDMWLTLGQVRFETSFDQEFMIETKKPHLSTSIQKLEGKQIEIEGYIIPLTGQKKQSHFMLSKFPQSTCFFCGKAGPETAMQVFMKDNEKINISERKVKVKGILVLNTTNLSNPLYTLEDAQVFE